MLWVKRVSTNKNVPNLNKYLKMNIIKRVSNLKLFDPVCVSFDMNPFKKANYAVFLFQMPNLQEKNGFANFVKWLIFSPVKILLYFTIPDCRVEK